MTTKQALIHKTLENISRLPSTKVQEVSDFAEFIAKKHDEEVLRMGMATLVSESKSFDFLLGEEDLYSVDDIKDK